MDIYLYPSQVNPTDIALRDPATVSIDGAATTDGVEFVYSVGNAAASGEGQATNGSAAEGLTATAGTGSGEGVSSGNSTAEAISATGAAASGEGQATNGSSSEAISPTGAAASGEGTADAGSAQETISVNPAAADVDAGATADGVEIVYSTGDSEAFGETNAPEETPPPPQYGVGGVFRPLHVALQRYPKKKEAKKKQVIQHPRVDGQATCEGVYTYIKVTPGEAGGDGNGATAAAIILALGIGKTIGSGEASTISEGVPATFSVNESEGVGELDEGELLDILRITHGKIF